MTSVPDPEMYARARNPERGPDGRLLSVRDAVEITIFRPPSFPAKGDHRVQIEQRRDAAIAELRAADAELAATVERRRELVERIRDCNLALTGTGEKRDHLTGETVQVLGNWVKRIPLDDPQPDVDDETSATLSGSALCAAVLEVLAATGVPMTLPEIERVLRLQGLVPAGRPSQTLANALRPAVRRGQVFQVDRGWYEIVP